MSYNWKAIGDALGIEHVWVNEAEYEDCFTPGNYATGWGFQEGEKNPRYSGGEEAARFQANIMMTMEATKEEVQNKIDEVIMDAF